MRIVSVHLKNIKSHRDTELTFSSGINVLSGANGSGKSTIFEAIGYALFGVNAQDFVSRAERFLTIGTKKGEISVVFEPAEGELYRVSRTVGTAGKWLLAKEVGGEFEVEEHANAEETEQRIASLLGLSETRPLAEQFKLVIGPFQNDFLGPFVIKQPTKRQAAFDEILGIDAWRKTFDGTKALAGAIQGKIDLNQAEIAGKLEQVAVLPAKEQELRGLRESSTAKQAESGQRQGELDRVTAQLAALDKHKESIDFAQSEAKGLEERVTSGKEYVANQQLLVEQAKAAAAVLLATTEGKRRYDAADERVKTLREQEKQKALAEKKVAELDKEQVGIRKELDIENRELTDLAAAIEADAKRLAEEENQLAKAHAELSKSQAEAGEGLAQATGALQTFRQLRVHGIEKELPYLQVALDRINALVDQSAEKSQLLEGSAALAAEAAELSRRQGELERAQAERSELAGTRTSLIEGRDKIGAGDCPFLHEPCKNLAAGDGINAITARIAAIDDRTRALDAQVETLSTQVTAAQTAAQELVRVEQLRLELDRIVKERQRVEQDFAAKLAAMAPAALLAEATQWLDTAGMTEAVPKLKDLDATIAGSPDQRRMQLLAWSDGWRSVLMSLEETLVSRVKQAEEPVQAANVKAAELKTRGQALDGKRRELATLQEKLLLRQKTIDTHQRRLHAVLESFSAEKTALSAFANLEDSIKAADEEVARYQGDRDLYIANQRDAQELEKRQKTLATYQMRLQELEGQLTAKRQELAELVARYHPEEHERARAERERLWSAVATLKAEVAGIAESIARLEGEIKALSAIAEEIRKKQTTIEELKEQAGLVKFLRNQVFKNVSSQLSERFREEITSRADRIYRSISDSDEELLWGENYQIVLKDMADDCIRERTDDQLSGGQMMSAVVALRLALLQTIGARIAFFDEPTSNLDAERRENLAKAFRAIDVGQEEVTEHWYDQLFLVSHDVSFTEITDQMIHLD
jgi:DNA repair protein SbcC/Rad50